MAKEVPSTVQRAIKRMRYEGLTIRKIMQFTGLSEPTVMKYSKRLLSEKP